MSRYEAEHITFSELIIRYQKEVTPYKKSASREISRLKCLNNFFGEISLARINSEMVARFRDERLSLKLSGATIIKDLNTLSHVIDTAIKEWVVTYLLIQLRIFVNPKLTHLVQGDCLQKKNSFYWLNVGGIHAQWNRL